MQDNIISYQDMPGFLISINKKHGSFKKKSENMHACLKNNKMEKLFKG